jgi:hypothetical protein
MNKKYIQKNIYFIVPIALWLAFYGTMLDSGSFTKLFTIMLIFGVVPYGILWLLSSRFPDKSEICKIGSTVLFSEKKI